MTAQDLKNAILQLAVQGKLVPQDPNDEPAAELLKRIKAEKERLIKEGKIIFFSTHILDVAEKLCSRVANINKGKIVKVGSMKEVKGDKSLEKVFMEMDK